VGERIKWRFNSEIMMIFIITSLTRYHKPFHSNPLRFHVITAKEMIFDAGGHPYRKKFGFGKVHNTIVRGMNVKEDEPYQQKLLFVKQVACSCRSHSKYVSVSVFFLHQVFVWIFSLPHSLTSTTSFSSLSLASTTSLSSLFLLHFSFPLSLFCSLPFF
jgi:hypothetical protein